MRAIALIVPGLSDVSLRALEGQTPLQKAAVPALDRLAHRGRLGTAQVIPADSPQGSVVGLPALLGFEQPSSSLRRGPLEAYGLGVEVAPEDLVMRLNFVSTFRGTMADTRAGHVSTREALVLLEALRRIPTPLNPRLAVGSGYRHLFVVPGGSSLEVGCIPPHDAVGQPLQDFRPFGKDADAFVSFLDAAHEVLKDHDVNRVRIDLGENPADAIWLWGEGVDVAVPPRKRELPEPAAMVAGAPLVRGLARKVGMRCPEIDGASGDHDTNLAAKWRAAEKLSEDHPLVWIHVASVNEASRVGDPMAKIQALEAIDRELTMPLLNWLDTDPGQRRVMVTSDHQTSVEAAVPGTDPVPFAVLGAGIEGVRARTFTEESAASSDLILPDAASLLDFFLGAGARAVGR